MSVQPYTLLDFMLPEAPTWALGDVLPPDLHVQRQQVVHDSPKQAVAHCRRAWLRRDHEQRPQIQTLRQSWGQDQGNGSA